MAQPPQPIGCCQPTKVSRMCPAFRRRQIFAHRHEAQGEGRSDDAFAVRDQRLRPIHPATPDALFQQHRGDGGGRDLVEDVE